MHSPERSLVLQFLGFLDTPPLWKDSGPIGIEQYLTRSVPEITEKLEDLRVPENLILGKRVEYFLAYYLEHYTTEKILAHNLVISSGNRTLGEIDFLLQDALTLEVTHLELAYKFYLYDSEIGPEEQRWIGPNRRDHLLKKLDRLEKHQFPLLFTEEVRQVINSLSPPLNKIQQKACFKASLFVPLKMLGRRLPLVNNECIQGYWIRWNEFTEREYGGHLFYSPRKPYWVLHPSSSDEWYDYNGIKEQLRHLLQQERSPLVWMKTSASDFERFFIVWW